MPASLAYNPTGDTNSAPFVLSPILKLPVSFGSAYVGETFSCTLCANRDLAEDGEKRIRDVQIEAEMKTPSLGSAQKLELGPAAGTETAAVEGVELGAGKTLQKVLSFDLKEEGNHVLAVTVSYYEASATSGRTRTFRKLYQFICKTSLIVRTKISPLAAPGAPTGPRRWVLEAQLENCSEEAMQLARVLLEAEEGFRSRDCNWEATGSEKPVLQPGEMEQVCFVIEEKAGGAVEPTLDGTIIFGVLGIGWRGEMGNRGFLFTRKLRTRVAAT